MLFWLEGTVSIAAKGIIYGADDMWQGKPNGGWLCFSESGSGKSSVFNFLQGEVITFYKFANIIDCTSKSFTMGAPARSYFATASARF